MLKKQIYSIGFFIASVLLAVASLILPVFFMSFSWVASIVCFFASVILSCVMFAFSVTNAHSLLIPGIGVILAFLGSWLLSGSATFSILFLIIFIPAGTALGLGYKNKKMLNATVMKAAVNAVILGLIAFTVLIGEFSGGSFDVKEALGPMTEKLKQYLIELFSVEDPSVSMVFDRMEISPKAFALFIYDYFITNIPTFYMSFVLIETVIGFWIIKGLMKRTDNQVSFMGRFSDCKISYVGSIFYLICVCCYMLLSEYDIAIAFYNYSNILRLVFIYAGVSLISYFLEFKKFSNFARNLILVIVIVISFTSTVLSSLVIFLGLLDSGMNFRNRIENSGV